MPWLLHLRPTEWPIVAAHMLLGWLLAAGFRWPPSLVVLGVAVWVIALNGGTLALNSAFDNDSGDIAFLQNPPTPPRGLALGAAGLMLLGLVIAWQLPAPFAILYLASVVMSVLYSVPPFRLKSVAGADLVINIIGFGTLTPWAGWALAGGPLDLAHALLLVAFAPLFAALYPLTQLYQMAEDRERGDRTLALRLGARGSLRFAFGAMLLAFALLSTAAGVSDWSGERWWRYALIATAAVAWLAVLLPWLARGARWSSQRQQQGMYHALVAWAVTDLAVLLAWRL